MDQPWFSRASKVNPGEGQKEGWSPAKGEVEIQIWKVRAWLDYGGVPPWNSLDNKLIIWDIVSTSRRGFQERYYRQPICQRFEDCQCLQIQDFGSFFVLGTRKTPKHAAGRFVKKSRCQGQSLQRVVLPLQVACAISVTTQFVDSRTTCSYTDLCLMPVVFFLTILSISMHFSVGLFERVWRVWSTLALAFSSWHNSSASAWHSIVVVKTSAASDVFLIYMYVQYVHNLYIYILYIYTLQGINISHLGKRKIIFKMPFLGDMLVSWRVYYV